MRSRAGTGLILLLNGIGMGLFASPNRAGIMNSLPPERRGVGAGMSATFQNSAMVLSIGIFFTLIILGLAASLPATLSHGLVAQGVPAADAARLAALPAVSISWSGGDHLERGQGGIGGVGDPAAVGRHLAQGRDRGGGDELARGQHRDAGRVGRDELGADPADRRVGGDRLVPGEIRLPG